MTIEPSLALLALDNRLLSTVSSKASGPTRPWNPSSEYSSVKYSLKVVRLKVGDRFAFTTLVVSSNRVPRSDIEQLLTDASFGAFCAINRCSRVSPESLSVTAPCTAKHPSVVHPVGRPIFQLKLKLEI
jgi:hypothetical protein